MIEVKFQYKGVDRSEVSGQRRRDVRPSTRHFCGAAQRVRIRGPRDRWQGRGPQTRCWRQGRGPQTRRLMRYGKASRISLILPLFKTVALANSLRGLAQQRKASSLLRRRRVRAPRGKLRRRNQRCSPSCRRFTTHTGRQRVSF